jgi:hypothetical protein
MRVTESEIRELVREVLNESQVNPDDYTSRYVDKSVKGSISQAARLGLSAIPYGEAVLNIFDMIDTGRGIRNQIKKSDWQSEIPGFMNAIEDFMEFLNSKELNINPGEDIIVSKFNKALKDSGCSYRIARKTKSGEAGEHKALDLSMRGDLGE